MKSYNAMTIRGVVCFFLPYLPLCLIQWTLKLRNSTTNTHNRGNSLQIFISTEIF